MMFTRFYGKCYVFSEVEDKNKTDEYCLKCFYEAEFIGLNSFNMPDLIFEISKCINNIFEQKITALSS